MAHQSSSYIYNFQDDPLAQSYIDPGYLPFAAPAAFSTPFDPSSSTPLDPVQSATYWGSHDEPQLPRFDYPISPVAAPAPASWTTVTGQAEAPHSQSSQKVTVAQALENVARMSTAVQANLVPAEMPARTSLPTAPLSSTIKPFILKLWQLVSSPDEFRDCIVWDETGTLFIINHGSPRFLQAVLPRFFEHTSIHSFTRQLNVYGFSRSSQQELASVLDVKSTANFSAWSHPSFLRDDSSRLVTMTPRPSRARALKKVEREMKMKEEEEIKRGEMEARRNSWGRMEGFA